MTTQKKTITLLFTFFYLVAVQAQTVAPPIEYTFNDNLNQWINQTNLGTVIWKWEEDGEADDGLDWKHRDSIYSASGGGAAVLDIDNHIATSTDTFISLELLLVPNLVLVDTAYLRFTQYYRQHGNSKIAVYLYADSEIPIDTIPIYPDLHSDVETAQGDIQVIKLNDFFDNIDTIKRIGFHYEGTGYFWIIDDVGFYEEEPFTTTRPAYVGDTLTALGYEWSPDKPANAWPYVPNEAVVQFVDGTSDSIRQVIRDQLGATKIDSCVCDKLELWRFGDSLIVPNLILPDSASIGINERVQGAKTTSEIDGIDLNRYNFNELIHNPPSPRDTLMNVPSSIVTTTEDVPIVAILDTGIDYNHSDLTDYIYRTNDVLNGLVDEDMNCNVNDPIGWNFVDDNNNPQDDHSHGTHVAGIIVQNLRDRDSLLNCGFRLRAYKTHDAQGVSNLWSVSCGTYQAIKDGAAVINDSWGFYGAPSPILSLAIQEAMDNNILIVSAAGNDTIDLDVLQQYPICEQLPNVVGVGSYKLEGDNTYLSSLFSNYSPTHVDIFEEGDSIRSTVPENNMYDFKTGTSMASPAVAAAAIAVHCADRDIQINDLKDCLIMNAFNDVLQTPLTQIGKRLDWEADCITAVDEIILNTKGTLYPNPTTTQLFFEIEDVQTMNQVSIRDISGRVIFYRQFKNEIINNNYQIPVHYLNQGIYILTVQGNDYIWSEKFIKI